MRKRVGGEGEVHQQDVKVRSRSEQGEVIVLSESVGVAKSHRHGISQKLYRVIVISSRSGLECWLRGSRSALEGRLGGANIKTSRFIIENALRAWLTG